MLADAVFRETTVVQKRLRKEKEKPRKKQRTHADLYPDIEEEINPRLHDPSIPLRPEELQTTEEAVQSVLNNGGPELLFEKGHAVPPESISGRDSEEDR